MMNTTHTTYKNFYLATFYLNNKVVTRPARLTDLLYCSECHKVTLPQYAMEYSDPCPFCNVDKELLEFDPYDYKTMSALLEVLENSGLEFTMFTDAIETEYYINNRLA